MTDISKVFLALFATLLPVTAMFAQDSSASDDSTAFKHPCRGQPWWADNGISFDDFDFWVGEWQVYDTATGEMRGFDDIEFVHDGCAVKQHWRQMDDLFTRPNLPWRLNGISLTGITWDGEWRQMWTDSNGGNMLLTGGNDDQGRMVLTSEWQARKQADGSLGRVRFIWFWQPSDDGTIHNWGEYQQNDENNDRIQYFDITYRPNAVGRPSPRLRAH